jgi:hypothetical protein
MHVPLAGLLWKRKDDDDDDDDDDDTLQEVLRSYMAQWLACVGSVS